MAASPLTLVLLTIKSLPPLLLNVLENKLYVSLSFVPDKVPVKGLPRPE